MKVAPTSVALLTRKSARRRTNLAHNAVMYEPVNMGPKSN